MKKLALILLGVVALFEVSVFSQGNLDDLYKKRQYFDLKEALNDKTARQHADHLYFQAVVANRFNDTNRSISLLQRYLKSDAKRGGRSRGACELLADNYMRTYQYRKAADTYRLLLKKFETVLTPAERVSYNNLAGLWGTLGSVGPQTVSINKGETVIQGTRDAAQLLNIPIELSGQKMDFIFDTGAGISTMTVSTAKKLGLQILEADVSVGSSTDISVKSKLAVAPELKIGDITARNVVFLVMEDKTLYVAPIKYQISAILGFPLIKSLRRVTLTRDNKVKINGPEGNRKEEPNMLLEGLKPLVAANYNNKRVIFALDTGANRTTFYPLLYSGSSESARAAAVSKTIRSGGAGGVQEVLGYKMKDVELSIGGKTAKFPEAEVLSDDKNERTAYYYGNLGQDLIKQYEKMTLDFVSMRLIFE